MQLTEGMDAQYRMLYGTHQGTRKRLPRPFTGELPTGLCHIMRITQMFTVGHGDMCCAAGSIGVPFQKG